MSEAYCYQESVYQGRGSYHEVDIEAETLDEFVRQMAWHQSMCKFKFDPERMYVRVVPPADTKQLVSDALPAAKARLEEANAAAKAEKERKTERERRASSANALRQELDRLRADLTPEAIARREAQIQALSRPEPTRIITEA